MLSARRVRSPSPTPQDSAKAFAARVGWPEASNAGGNRRTTPLDALLRLALDELSDEHGEPARREIGERGAMRKPRGIQARNDCVAKCFGERDEAFRRHFLGADLDQEVVAGHGVPEGTVPFSEAEKATVPGGFVLSRGKPWASRLACQAAATARASARTRRM